MSSDPVAGPSEDVLEAFGASGAASFLASGVWRSGDLVFKRVTDPRSHAWVSERVEGLRPEGIRIQRAVRTRSGQWDLEDWAAFGFLPGANLEGELPRKLEIASLFHDALAGIDGSRMPRRTDPWAVADRVAWDEEPLPSDLAPEASDAVWSLLEESAEAGGEPALVHADLCGNILVDPAAAPAIIDLSLCWRPRAYAEGILVYDSLIWEGGLLADIGSWLVQPGHVRHLKKAAAFRLVVTAIFDRIKRRRDFEHEWALVKRLLGDLTK